MITAKRHCLWPEPQRQFMNRLHLEKRVSYVTTIHYAPAYGFFSGNAFIVQHAEKLPHCRTFVTGNTTEKNKFNAEHIGCQRAFDSSTRLGLCS